MERNQTCNQGFPRSPILRLLRQGLWGISVGLALGLMQGCEFPSETTDPPAKKEGLTTPITIQFLNADVGAERHPRRTRVSITDEARLLRNPNGSQANTFELTDGYMNVVLFDSLIANQEPPYVFTVQVAGDGFLSKTEVVEVDEFGPSLYVPVFMIDEKNPPAGVGTFAQGVSIAANGALTAPISFSTPSSNQQSENFSIMNVQIREGIQLLGANGKPLQSSSGRANFSMYKFDPRFPASINAFPGGFRVSEARDASGKPIILDQYPVSAQNPIFFATLGYTDIRMQVDEQEVEGFSAPIEVTMEIPSKMTNPDTGEPIQIGDSVPVWSMNSRTGSWTLEQNAVVQKGLDGRMVGTFYPNHLSVWNFDGIGPTCPKPSADIEVVIRNQNASGGAGNPKIRYAALHTLGSASPLAITGAASDATNFLFLAPGDNTLELRAYPDPSTFTDMGFYLSNTPRPIDFASPPDPRFTLPEPCGSVSAGTGTGAATLDPATGNPVITLNQDNECTLLRVEINCPDGGGTCYRPDLASVFYRGIGTTDTISFMNYTGNFSNGQVELDLTGITDGLYIFGFTFNNEDFIRFILDYESGLFSGSLSDVVQLNLGATDEDDEIPIGTISVSEFVPDPTETSCGTGTSLEITIDAAAGYTCTGAGAMALGVTGAVCP